MAALSSTRSYRRGAPPSLPDDGRFVANEFKKIEAALNGIQAPSAIDISGKLDKTANLSDVANVATSRNNLGLGSAATHAATDFDAAGAAAAVAATLGTAAFHPDTDFQAHHANLDAFSGLSGVADRLPLFTGASELTLLATSAFSQGLFSEVDATHWRAALGITAASNQFESVVDHGASNTGSITISGTGTDSKFAFDAAGGASNFVLVPAGVYRFAADQTYPSYVTWWFLPGATLCPDTGVTVAFQGPVIASPHYRIFGDNGTINGITQVCAEHFGGSPSLTDNATPINRAIQCAENGVSSVNAALVFTFGRGTYAVASTITFKLDPSFNWHVRGASAFSTAIRATSSFSGSAVIHFDPVPISDGAGGFYSTGEARIHDLAIRNLTAAGGPTSGLLIGAGSNHFNSTIVSWVRVTGLYVNGFDINVNVNDASGVLFDNVVTDCHADSHTDETPDLTSGGDCFRISAPAGGAATEIHFTNCQAKVDGSGNGLHINDFGASTVNLSGIGISGIDFYFVSGSTGFAINIWATGSGGNGVSDIWITGSRNQIEGVGTNYGIQLRAEGSGRIFNVHVDHTYITGGGFVHGIKASVGSGGTISGLFINDNEIVGCTSEGIYLNGGGGTMYGAVVHDNWLKDCGGGGTNSTVFIGDCDKSTVHDNTGARTGSPTIGVFLQMTSCDWLTAHDNNSGGSWYTSGWIDSGCTASNIHDNV